MTGTVPVDGAAFRSAMALLAAPVTVVTGRTAEGDPFGFTASAVTSLSLDPPLLLICVNRGANSHDPLVRARSFCVNVLDDEADACPRESHRCVRRWYESSALLTVCTMAVITVW
jgi:flavin reductase (DIM6/NTAB) family NADH-FMN oxidoreductase RutF